MSVVINPFAVLPHNVSALQAFYRDPHAASYSIQRKTLMRTDVEERFGAFLPLRNHGVLYHVFISYRFVRPVETCMSSCYTSFLLFAHIRLSHRHGADSDRASCLVNALSTHTVGVTGELLNIFFDSFSLCDGAQFDVTFMLGLSRALVVAPFITADAMERMCALGSHEKVDNVLLEWWLALTLYKSQAAAVKAILPIFYGKVSGRRGLFWQGKS